MSHKNVNYFFKALRNFPLYFENVMNIFLVKLIIFHNNDDLFLDYGFLLNAE